MTAFFRYSVLLIFLCLFVVPSPARAEDSIEDIRANIASMQANSARLEAEIKQLTSDLQKVGGEKATLQKAINQLELERKKVLADISYTQNRIGATDLEIDKLSIEITDTETLIAAHKAAITETIQTLNELDDHSMVELLLTYDNLATFWDGIDTLAYARQAIQDKVYSLASHKVLLGEQHNATTEKRGELIDLKNQYSDQNKVLTGTTAEKNELLTATKNEEAEYQKLLAEKKAEKQRFEQQMSELEAKLQFLLDPTSIPSRGTAVFSWPLKDVFITQNFGATKDAQRLYTTGTHNGVDFRAVTGTAVYAALSGTVLATNETVANMCQYGKWVLIKHPNGLTTLYAHLSVVSVTPGAAVKTGQVVGYSGSTGYATGPHLHFTVYASAAVNFRQYTCNSGATLTIPVAAATGYLDPLDYLPH